MVLASNTSSFIDFNLSYSGNLSKVKNSIKPGTAAYFSQVTMVRVNLLSSSGWLFQNDLTNQSYSGLTQGYNQHFCSWNLSAGKNFLKKQAGEIKLSVFDLLKQNRNISRVVNETYIEDSKSLVLQQYFMLTFTYRFKAFAGSKYEVLNIEVNAVLCNIVLLELQKTRTLNEWILIDKLKQRDEAAFKTIVETWQEMVFNTALSIVQSTEDAEDVSQEVFVQVYESIHSFKGESKFSTWLYRIVLTKSMDHIRKKKRKKRFAYIQSLFGLNNEIIYDPPDFQHPGVKLDNKETAAILFKTINKLPENQKIAFILHKVEGLSYQQICEVMSTTLSSVESLLHRAKNNLKKYLEQENRFSD